MFPSCFYIADGEHVGPISRDELLDLARHGKISGETLVWSEDSAQDWQPFSIWSRQAGEAAGEAGVMPHEDPEVLPPTSSAALAASAWDQAAGSPVDTAAGALPAIADDAGSAGQKRYRKIAGYSWWSVILSIGIKQYLDLTLATAPTWRLRVSIVSTSFWLLTGLVAGVVALTGVRRYGRKGILVPAIVGLGIWVTLIALGVTQMKVMRNMALAKAAARPKVVLKPLVSDPASLHLSGKDPDFSLEIPNNFWPMPASEKPADTLYAYTRPAGPPDLKDVIMIKVLPEMLTREPTSAAELPKGMNLTHHNWRGVPLEGFRVEMHEDGVDYVTVQVQVPLKPKAIQFGVGMPITKEPELFALIQKMLASLDGESNW